MVRQTNEGKWRGKHHFPKSHLCHERLWLPLAPLSAPRQNPGRAHGQVGLLKVHICHCLSPSLLCRAWSLCHSNLLLLLALTVPDTQSTATSSSGLCQMRSVCSQELKCTLYLHPSQQELAERGMHSLKEHVPIQSHQAGCVAVGKLPPCSGL